jgi:hypothetical protein
MEDCHHAVMERLQKLAGIAPNVQMLLDIVNSRGKNCLNEQKMLREDIQNTLDQLLKHQEIIYIISRTIARHLHSRVFQEGYYNIWRMNQLIPQYIDAID